MCVLSEDKQHDQKNWNFWWYEIDGDGTPYDSPVKLSADDFEYIRNLYNEYIKKSSISRYNTNTKNIKH